MKKDALARAESGAKVLQGACCLLLSECVIKLEVLEASAGTCQSILVGRPCPTTEASHSSLGASLVHPSPTITVT